MQCLKVIEEPGAGRWVDRVRQERSEEERDTSGTGVRSQYLKLKSPLARTRFNVLANRGRTFT